MTSVHTLFYNNKLLLFRFHWLEDAAHPLEGSDGRQYQRDTDGEEEWNVDGIPGKSIDFILIYITMRCLAGDIGM